METHCQIFIRVGCGKLWAVLESYWKQSGILEGFPRLLKTTKILKKSGVGHVLSRMTHGCVWHIEL